MKEQFPGHFHPSKQDIEELWNSALIVFDTNVLLKLYGYSEDAKKDFLAILDIFQKRLWLPNRVVEEFLNLRINKVSKDVKQYDAIAASIKQIEVNFKNVDSDLPLPKELLDSLNKCIAEFKKEFTINHEAAREKLISDPLLEKLETVFKGCVGEAFSEQEIEKICEEGKNRYRQKIPPGFEDISKADPDNPTLAYGDLIIWKEILRKAKESKSTVIFVTNEQKKDWWLSFGGSVSIPHPKLIKEFKGYTGQKCYIYRPDAFREYAAKHTKQKVSAPVLKEIKKASLEADSSTVPYIGSTLKNLINESPFERLMRETEARNKLWEDIATGGAFGRLMRETEARNKLWEDIATGGAFGRLMRETEVQNKFWENMAGGVWGKGVTLNTPSSLHSQPVGGNKNPEQQQLSSPDSESKPSEGKPEDPA